MSMGYLKSVTVLLLLAPLSVLASESIDKSWDIDAGARVSVENVSGEVIVRGWDKNEARLTGELGDSVKELRIDASKSSLQITVINRNERNIDETELKLMIPEGASLEVSTVSADVEASGMNNEKLTIDTVSGDVEVTATSKRVSIESVSGDVEFGGQTQRISAESVSGDIDLSGIGGDIEATTVSGDVELQAGRIESAKLETVSGDMLVKGEISDSGSLSAESMSGDVVIVLPAAQAGLFRAESFSGRIHSDFGSVDRAEHGPGSHLKHRIGKGDAEVRVESFSGNIKLRND